MFPVLASCNFILWVYVQTETTTDIQPHPRPKKQTKKQVQSCLIVSFSLAHVLRIPTVPAVSGNNVFLGRFPAPS